MSSATPSPFERDHRLYLEDMLEFSEAVIAYTRGQTLASWQADPMRMDATLRKLTLIGEAATRARRHPRAGAGHPVAQDRGHA